jgi:hypothetical protein
MQHRTFAPEGNCLSERSRSTALTFTPLRQRHADGLWTQRVDCAQPAVVSIRVRVIEQVDGVAGVVSQAKNSRNPTPSTWTTASSRVIHRMVLCKMRRRSP